MSSTPAAKQATISPSQSPQSSDAENQPPSSKPSTSADNSRVALAPVTTPGPVSSSPSKSSRNDTNINAASVNGNILANLQTAHPWTSVDIDLVFGELLGDKEHNGGAPPKLNLLGGSKDVLTTPEKGMSVEDWIYHNAGQAEQKLRLECEAMVTAFEREGTRAMTALEGLVAE